MITELKQFIRDRCYDFGVLYSLEEEFNKIGLTIQATCSGDMILCKLAGGKPVAESLGTDHLFIGTQSRPRDEISHKLIEGVLEFIDVAAGGPSSVAAVRSKARTGFTGLYGRAMEIGPVMQGMALSQSEIQENLLESIKDWCDSESGQI